MASMQHVSHVTWDIDSLQSLRFSRPRDMVSIQRFAQRFGYDIGRIEVLCRLEPGIAHTNPFNARVQQFMRSALDVVAWRMVDAPDLDAAIEWFKTRLLGAHGDRTPEEVVADGDSRQLLKGRSSHN